MNHELWGPPQNLVFPSNQVPQPELIMDQHGAPRVDHGVQVHQKNYEYACKNGCQSFVCILGNIPFESMTELIEHYQKSPLYRKTKLKYSCNQQVVQECGQNPDNEVRTWSFSLGETYMGM